MLNVFPCPSYDYCRNQCPGNLVLSSQLSLQNTTISVIGSNLFHILLRQPCVTIRDASCMPIFGNAICNVVKLCSKPKMIWINASWIVASWAIVEHTQSFCNWSVSKNPCKSRSSPILSKIRKLTVATSGQRTEPNPTGIGFTNFVPKNDLWIVGTFSRAASFTTDSRRIFLEFFSADRTLVDVHLKPFFLGVRGLVVRAINSAFFSLKQSLLQGLFRISNVLPELPEDDHRDKALADSVILGERGLLDVFGFVEVSDLFHRFLGELRHAIRAPLVWCSVHVQFIYWITRFWKGKFS